MQSSAPCDGVLWLARRQRSSRRGALFYRIDGASHRQSSAIRPSFDQRGRRQDSVRSVVPDLHRSSSARADLLCLRWSPSTCGRHAFELRSHRSSMRTQKLAGLAVGALRGVYRGCRCIADVERAVAPHRMYDHRQFARHRDTALRWQERLAIASPQLLTLSLTLKHVTRPAPPRRALAAHPRRRASRLRNGHRS